jgi:SAM-dependent methyltransferase
VTRGNPLDDTVLTEASRIFTPEYYDELRRLEAGAWWNAGMRAIASQLLEAAQLPRRGRVLDAGCGSGQTMAWLKQALPEWEMTGIDVSHDAVLAAASLGESVALASVTDLPFAEKSFGLLVSLDVLQHLPLNGGDAVTLAEFRRVLEPGGILLIRTNSQLFPRVADDALNMYRRYDPDPLRLLLTNAGFDVLRLSRANSLLGLAEIPRELRARKNAGRTGYYGLLSKPRRPSPVDAVKREILRLEGSIIARGAALPFGRTLFALCRAI